MTICIIHNMFEIVCVSASHSAIENSYLDVEGVCKLQFVDPYSKETSEY